MLFRSLVGEPDVEMPDLQPGIRLRHDRGSSWHVERDGRELARYDWDDIRLSISWKAYCFADEAERRRVEEHTDDLDHDRILAMLVEDLRRRGRVGDSIPEDRALGEMLMREYIRFPLQPHARRPRPAVAEGSSARPA